MKIFRMLNDGLRKMFEIIANESGWDYNRSGKFINNVQKYERYQVFLNYA